MKNLLTLVAMAFSMILFGQEDSVRISPLKISGYAEVYYNYDFGNPQNHQRPGFIYSHNRHNEINLNLVLIKAEYATENIRGNLALAAGTYMNANYAAEEGVLKNIYEANVGIKLSKTQNIWLDAGILPSHIGWESAIGKDNYTLIRSLAAENSPYFETGARLSYNDKSGKWYFAFLVLNGWQRIARADGNNTPAFGHQLTYQINDKMTLNSSSFVGNDKAYSIRQMRYFHNLYGIFKLSKKWALTAGFDIGAEQKTTGSKQYNSWYTPAIILKFQPNENSSLAMRGEYFSDKNGVIIPSLTPNGFQTFGYSINYDYRIATNVLWRMEARSLNSKDPLFFKNNKASHDNFLLSTSLSIAF